MNYFYFSVKYGYSFCGRGTHFYLETQNQQKKVDGLNSVINNEFENPVLESNSPDTHSLRLTNDSRLKY